jgi:hypothetical protein
VGQLFGFKVDNDEALEQIVVKHQVNVKIIKGGFPKTSVFGKASLNFAVLQG